jgi:amino acid transporter
VARADTTPNADRRGEALGPPSLTTPGVLAQTLAIGPIFSAAFLAGTVAVVAGFNTPLSVLLAGVGTLGLAYALVLYGRRFAGAGGVYEYLRRGVHPSIGVVGGGAYLLGLLFLGAGGGFVADGYLMDNLLRGELSLDLGWLLWALVFLAVVIAVNYTGVRVGIGAIALTAAISAVPLAVVAVAIIADGGADGNTLAVFDPSRTSWDAVFHGILFAVALFIGFEAVAALGEEARLPRRSIPIAMISSIAIYLAFYLVITYAGAIGFGEQALRKNAWFASGNPFGELGERYVGHSLGWLVNLAIVLDLLSVLIAFTLAASRLLMSLAREGLLPRAVARTSPRYHSPVGGLAVIAAWALLVMLWAGLTRYGDSVGLPNILQAILILSATGSYLIALVYLLLAGGALRLLWSDRDRGGLWWRLPVVLAGVAVPILSFDGSLNPFPDDPNDNALYLACGALALSVLWYAALRLLRPGALRADRPARIRAGDDC